MRTTAEKPKNTSNNEVMPLVRESVYEALATAEFCFERIALVVDRLYPRISNIRSDFFYALAAGVGKNAECCHSGWGFGELADQLVDDFISRAFPIYSGKTIEHLLREDFHASGRKTIAHLLQGVSSSLTRFKGA